MSVRPCIRNFEAGDVAGDPEDLPELHDEDAASELGDQLDMAGESDDGGPG